MTLDTVQLLLLEMSNDATRPVLLAYFEALERAEQSEENARKRMISVLVRNSFDSAECKNGIFEYIQVFNRTGLRRAAARNELLKVLKEVSKEKAYL